MEEWECVRFGKWCDLMGTRVKGLNVMIRNWDFYPKFIVAVKGSYC